MTEKEAKTDEVHSSQHLKGMHDLLSQKAMRIKELESTLTSISVHGRATDSVVRLVSHCRELEKLEKRYRRIYVTTPHDSPEVTKTQNEVRDLKAMIMALCLSIGEIENASNGGVA